MRGCSLEDLEKERRLRRSSRGWTCTQTPHDQRRWNPNHVADLKTGICHAAEAELMALLESLIMARSVGALVEAVFGWKAALRLNSDSTAAIAIAAGKTSSWRTRHLRIRAAGLTEALRAREVSLSHVAGTELVADGMTKQLTGQSQRNFKKALNMTPMGDHQEAVIKKIELKNKLH